VSMETMERELSPGALKALKSTLTDNHPLSLPSDYSDAAVAELHEMLLEIRNFAANLLKGQHSPSIRIKGYLPGVMKSLQAQLRSLSLQARSAKPNGFDHYAELNAEPMGDFADSLNLMARQLAEAKKQLEETNQILRLHMDIDPLTGLYNFSYLMKTLEREIERSRRYNQPLAIVLLEIANLKRISDSYGWRGEDAVMEKTAAQIRQILRPSDTAGRYGSGGILLILPNTDRAGACVLAERAQALNEVIQYADSKINIKLNSGVSIWENDKLSDLIREAECDLHLSKHKTKMKQELS